MGGERLDVFPLPQQSGFLKSFQFASNLVDRGWNILVFPEGRTTNGDMTSFRSGIGLLAAKLGIEVVAMFLDGLADLKRENRTLARPEHVRVSIGRPVRFEPTQDSQEIARELERQVRELQSAENILTHCEETSS
jgi:long-chain acyl-CoA synthetase